MRVRVRVGVIITAAKAGCCAASGHSAAAAAHAHAASCWCDGSLLNGWWVGRLGKRGPYQVSNMCNMPRHKHTLTQDSVRTNIDGHCSTRLQVF